MVVGRNDHQSGTLLAGLPENLAGLDAIPLGNLVLGQHDAVPVLLMTAHHHGLVPQLGMVEALDVGIEAVHIRMEDYAAMAAIPEPRAVHAPSSLKTNICS